MTLSALLTCALCAARCACLNRLTLCSGVSPGILEAALGVAAEVADFEVAWGMVEVNLVASLTLRGPIRDAILRFRKCEGDIKRSLNGKSSKGDQDCRDTGQGERTGERRSERGFAGPVSVRFFDKVQAAESAKKCGIRRV